MTTNLYKVHTPPSWPKEKRAKFLAWLNDELARDEADELLKMGGKK